MIVRNLGWSKLIQIADGLNLQAYDGHMVRNNMSILRFKLRAKDAHTYYSRKSISGRRGHYVCFHGWRDFIRVVFARGASQVSTTLGTWRTVEEFDADLARIAGLNVGSEVSPVLMPSLCTHEGPLPALLNRAVEAARQKNQPLNAVA